MDVFTNTIFIRLQFEEKPVMMKIGRLIIGEKKLSSSSSILFSSGRLKRLNVKLITWLNVCPSLPGLII